MPRAKKAPATTTTTTNVVKPTMDSDEPVEDQAMEEPVAPTAATVEKKKGRPKKAVGKQTVGEDKVEVPTSTSNGGTAATEAKKRKAPATMKASKPKDVKPKQKAPLSDSGDEEDEPSPTKVAKKAPAKAKKPAEAKTSKNTEKSPKKAAAGKRGPGRPAKRNGTTTDKPPRAQKI